MATRQLVCAAAVVCLTLAGCHRGVRKPQNSTQTESNAAAAPVQPAFANVNDELLAASAGENWLSYGGGFANQRYSTLDQVTRANVADLALAWIYQTGISESFQTTPVVAGNVLFLTTPESHVVALNGASGQKLWEFIPRLQRTSLCCGPNNRGVAAYGDKVYVGTIDAHLIALQQQTGQVVWDAMVGDSLGGSSITMAPLAYDGRVFVGVAGGEFGVRGRVVALDAQTGREVWRFYTVPGPGEAGQGNGWIGQWKETDPFGTTMNRDIPTEQRFLAQGVGENWKHGGGGVYTTPAYDPTTATLYFCVGNPSPDLNGYLRPGDNLFTGSVVALDGRTGQLKWYFQEVPHDLWNLSPASPPVLFDVKGHRYLAQAGKTGWLYVVDAATGKPVIRSDNFVPQENLFAPPSDSGVRMVPGANGGAGWASAAYSPRTGWVYVQVVHQPMVYTRGSQPRGDIGELWLGGTFRYLPGEQQWGAVTAIDPLTGDIRWQRQAPRPNLSSVLATAGDLVFAGQADGSFDAFDARTGDVVWEYPTGAGVSGGAVTYSIGGVQYVGVAAGGDAQLNTQRGNNFYVFALRSHIPANPVENYPEPRYPRSGAVRPATRPTTAPAPPPQTAPPGTAPAAPGAQPGATPTTTPAAAPTTSPAAAPGAIPSGAATTGPAPGRPPVHRRGPKLLGRPIPNPVKR